MSATQMGLAQNRIVRVQSVDTRTTGRWRPGTRRKASRCRLIDKKSASFNILCMTRALKSRPGVGSRLRGLLVRYGAFGRYAERSPNDD
eukprot:scaffold94731_cov25-Prasinocladus_malaysianus.AAC.1